MSEKNWPNWLPLRQDLAPLSPYGAPQVPAEATLNTNENPYAPSPALAKAIADRIHQVSLNLNRYPDRDATSLRHALASFINNLSNTSFERDQVWAAAKEEISTVKPSLTFITTPNNPTGTTVTLDEISQLADAAAKISGLLIVDEAYAEFSNLPSAVTLIGKYPNLVVIRTMSKAFAFAGARLGYLIADPEVVSAMFLVRLPYHLSSLTQAAAEVALEFEKELLGTVSSLIDSRKIVVSELQKMGLQVIPSQANFILFTGFSQEPAQLWRQLLDRGVLIRDVGLLGHLRMTIGNEAENQKFIAALQEILNGESQ